MKYQLRAFLLAGAMATSLVGTANAYEIGRDASAHHGQGHHRDGYGRDNFINAIGAVVANSASVSQAGQDNATAVVQTGQGNTAGIRQVGRNNSGAITQTGSNNAACLIQFGRGLDGAIVQTGDNQSTGVLQTRLGSREIPAEVCSTDSNGRGFLLGMLRRAGRR